MGFRHLHREFSGNPNIGIINNSGNQVNQPVFEYRVAFDVATDNYRVWHNNLDIVWRAQNGVKNLHLLYQSTRSTGIDIMIE
jgi:hypothetical protein